MRRSEQRHTRLTPRRRKQLRLLVGSTHLISASDLTLIIVADISTTSQSVFIPWWAWMVSNHRPLPYKGSALTPELHAHHGILIFEIVAIKTVLPAPHPERSEWCGVTFAYSLGHRTKVGSTRP